MITTKELQTLNVGVYKFYWKTGGSSIVAVGVKPDGHRWSAPLNWSSTSDISNINDGEVVRYIKLLDQWGEPEYDDSIESDFTKMDSLLEKSNQLLNELPKRASHNKKTIPPRWLQSPRAFVYCLTTIAICVGLLLIL